MNAKKITAIVLLVLFVLSLPLSLLAADFGSILFNQSKVTGLVVNNLVSDQALPALVHEGLLLEAEHGDLYKPFMLRMIVNVVGGVDKHEFVDLLNIVLPEKDRVKLVDQVVGGLFAWFDNNQPYPDITIPISPIVDRVKSNTPAISAWIFRTFYVPACDATTVAAYQSGNFGTDVQGLVTCKPPAELKDKVVTATAAAILTTIEKQAPPSEIRLAEMLKAQVPAEQMLALKAQLNLARKLVPFLWMIPLLFLLVALGLAVRSLKDLIAWVQWPFFVAGGLGTLLVIFYGDPTPLITKALLPPPQAVIPTPAVAVLLSLANGLFARVSAVMLWESVPLLIIGAVLLAYSYRKSLATVPGGLLTFLRSLVPPQVEVKA